LELYTGRHPARTAPTGTTDFQQYLALLPRKAGSRIARWTVTEVEQWCDLKPSTLATVRCVGASTLPQAIHREQLTGKALAQCLHECHQNYDITSPDDDNNHAYTLAHKLGLVHGSRDLRIIDHAITAEGMHDWDCDAVVDWAANHAGVLRNAHSRRKGEEKTSGVYEPLSQALKRECFSGARLLRLCQKRTPILFNGLDLDPSTREVNKFLFSSRFYIESTLTSYQSDTHK
jgi:hypothetical protein